MIYQIHGLNIVCNFLIDALKDYRHDKVEKRYPIITIAFDPNLDRTFIPEIETHNQYVDIYYSSNAMYMKLKNGTSVLVENNQLTVGGKGYDSRILNEVVSGPSIIMVSRFNQRAVLHGSAFLYKDKAYLILALPGAGKSTLSTAMAHYHKDIAFLCDDVICVSCYGKSIYNGIHTIRLNVDSFCKLFPKHKNTQGVLENVKTKYPAEQFVVSSVDAEFEIGGVFFLEAPLSNGLIKFTELNKFEFVCDTIKNIKLRKGMTSTVLTQELQIIDRMTNNAFASKIHMVHDYSKLENVTNEILHFINQKS